MQLQKFNKLSDYQENEKWLDSLRLKNRLDWMDAVRWYTKNDLYYLARYVTTFGSVPHSTYGTPFLEHQIYVDACRQYEEQIALGTSLDHSCRRSGKSELRSCVIPIHMMINHPNIAMVIFSVQKDLAQKHLVRIMNELEKNKRLQILFPEIFWSDPRNEAAHNGVSWSKTDGLVIRGRTMNRSTPTIEVAAMFGGGPVGSGYDAIFFDDIENSARVATAESIEDLDAAYSTAISLLTPVVLPSPLIVVSNTKFSEIGLVQRIHDRYKAKNPRMVRGVPGEDLEDVTDFTDEFYTGEGPLGKRAVYPNTPDGLALRYEEYPNKIEYILQYGLSYRSEHDRALRRDKILYYEETSRELAKDMVTYLCIDASRGAVDPTCMWVWGLAHDKRKFWLDAVVKKLDPATQEFHDNVFRLATMWNGLSKYMAEIRVEDTASSTWTELIERELRSRGCYIPVVKVKVFNRGGARKFSSGKMDRIYDHWSPMLNRNEVWFPKPAAEGGKGIMQEEDGKNTDLVQRFFSVEFDNFPRSKHDDMLDAGGMIEDEKINESRPLQYPGPPANLRNRSGYRTINPYGGGSTWMSA